MNNCSVSVTPSGGGQCGDCARQAPAELVSFAAGWKSVAILDAVFRGEMLSQG